MSSMRAAKQVQAHYYNRSAHDKPGLHRDDTVRVKVDEKSDWVKGKIAEVLPYRSYKVQTEDNRIFRRNRRHIRFSNEDPVIFRYEDEMKMIIRLRRLHQLLAARRQSALPSPPTNEQTVAVSQRLTANKNNNATITKTITTRSGRTVKKPSRYEN